MKKAMSARMKRGLSILLVLTMLFALLTPVSAAAAGATDQTVELQVGESKTLRLSGWSFRTTWTSSDEAIATVTSRGVVTAVAPGTAVVTAVSRGFFGFGEEKTTTFAVVVTEAEEPESPETPEVPEEEVLTVRVNETLELSVDADGGEVSWTSSDEAVATVDGDGVVTGVSEGEVTITATVKKTTGRFWFFWWGGSTTTTTTEFEITVLPADEEPTDPEEPVDPDNPNDPDEPTDPDDPDNPDEEIIYTVTFDTNEGSEIEEQTVLAGDSVHQPADPTKEGFVFDGWYADEELTEEYDFTQPVNGDITIYAGWKEMTAAITLNAGDYGNWVVNRTVTGSVSANITIEEVTYTLNDTDSGEITLDADGNFTLSVLLQDGSNTLTVSVTTSDGSVTQKSVTMDYVSGYVYDVDDSKIIKKSLDGSGVPAEDSGEEAAALSSEESFEDGETYLVANILSLYFRDSVTFADREQFVTETLGAEVAGYLNALSMMQALLPDTLPDVVGEGYTGERSVAAIDAEDLHDYAEALQAAYPDILEYAAIDYMYAGTETAVTTNDPWDTSNAADAQDDWWLDMVDAYEAWEYDYYESGIDYLQNIKVGVIDNGFDDAHEDLQGKITMISKEDSPEDPNKNGHGTHVAGILGAIADNGKGIAGIMYNNAQLLCYDYTDSKGNGSSSEIRAGLVKAVEKGAKVINISSGSSAPPKGCDGWFGFITDGWGRDASACMGKLLNRGYDFVVVQAAGNGNWQYRGINYWENGLFASINQNNCYPSFLQKLDSDITVTKEDIMSRILIVSNVGLSGTMTTDSNGGKGELHIVAAPGKSVYSTLLNDTYGWYGGTSMAAPVATGICAMVWSVNPGMRGDKVVDMVVNNTVGTAVTNEEAKTEGGMGIVNAYQAVKSAVTALPDYSGRITDATTGNGIAGAVISLYKGTQNGDYIADFVADTYGDFTLPDLQHGVYKLRIKASGYEDTSYSFSTKPNATSFNLGGIAMNPELDEDDYRIILTWNDTVADLDSHLVAETKSGEEIHLYYMTMSDGIAQANLDVDDTDYYGPETITITNIADLKNIRYAVHDFSNLDSTSSKAMSGSAATVKVYKGSTLLNTFTVPTNTGGTEWDVFAIDASGRIVATNRMTYCTDPEAVLTGAAGAAAASASAAAAGKTLAKEK